MKKIVQYIMVMLLCWGGSQNVAKAYNVLSGYKIDCDTLLMKPGTEREVTLYLTNAGEMEPAYQVDVTFPTGMKPVSLGSAIGYCQPIGGGATIKSKYTSADNSLRILVTNNDNVAEGDRRAIARIKVQTTNAFQAVGNITFSNMVFTRADGSVGSYGTTANVQATPLIYVSKVTLNKTTAQMQENETVQLQATVTPANATNKKLQWTSSNAWVAEVDANGKVTARTLGETTITATTTDGTNLSAQCQVTVYKPMATDMWLDRDEVTMHVGDSVKLTAAVQPANVPANVMWKSMKPDIATVDQNGMVKAYEMGTTVIMAVTTDGSYLMDACVVTVAPVLVNSLTLDQDSVTIALMTGNQVELNATVMPENASVKALKWTTSNAKVATVKNGVVTGVGEGNAEITATTTDGSNLSATCKVRVLEAWVESIVIKPKDLFMKPEQKDTLEVVILPTQATIKAVKWTSSNNKVVTVTDGVVIAVGVGQADITATATDGTGVTGTCHVTVTSDDVTRGDANGDTYVDVTDYLVTANYIMWEGADEANRGAEPHPFVFGAADVDADSLITVNDLTGIINIGLGREEVPKGAKVKGMTMPTPALSGNLTGNELALALSHEMLIAGVQLDVTVPEGAGVEDVTLTSRAGHSHKVRFAEMGGSRVRVLVSSTTNEILNGMAGDLLTLKLAGDVSGEVLVQHAIASAADATAYRLNDLRLAPIATGMNEMADGKARIYQEAGQLVIESAEAGTAQLVQMGGAAQTLNVLAGRNVYDVPVAGIVVVRMGANAVKLTF